MPRPEPTEYAPFYETYVRLVPEPDILPVLAAQHAQEWAFWQRISEADSLVRHAPYTWSTREVIGHMIDGERVFTYRALRIGRGDQTPLPSFDEQLFAQTAEFDRIPLQDLVAEFDYVRQASLSLFRHLPAVAWTRDGTASNARVTVRALAYIVAGHVRHHGAILRKRLAEVGS